MITPTFTDQMKELLLKEKERLENNLAQLGKTSGSGGFETQWEEYGDNEEDNAAEVDAFTNSLGVGGALEQELDAIKMALEKINVGTYGVCDRCQKEISELRLQVRPQAQYCIPCMEVMQ